MAIAPAARRTGRIGRSSLGAFWRTYLDSSYGRAGLYMLFALVLIAVLAPLLAPHDPGKISYDMLLRPSRSYPLGTDGMGRDVLSQIIYGTRVSLLVGFTSALISAFIGTVVGAFAGYYGGLADEIVSKIIDVFLLMPTFFLVLIIIAIFGNNLPMIMVVIGLTSWPGNARLMRAQALTLRERTFTLAARAVGESNGAILLRYIIPNGFYPIVANTTLQMGGAILTEAALSFLGLGDPNLSSWGKMIYEGRGYITSAWWVAAFPGIGIVLTVLAFYFIGDGIHHAINPRSRRGGDR